MRVLIASYGTLGDIAPFVALGDGFRQAGHEVTIATARRFEHEVSKAGLAFAAMTDQLIDLMDSEHGRIITGGDANVLKTLRAGLALNRRAAPINAQLMDDTWRAADSFRPDCLLYHPKVLAGPHVAEKLGVPAMLAGLQPMFVPTSAFPAAGMPRLPLSAGYNRLTYKIIHASYGAYTGAVNSFRARLGLQKLARRASPISRRDGKAVHALHGYSGAVVPAPEDWPETAHVCGYWMRQDTRDWTPSDSISRFLAKGSPPVYVGFGSVVGQHAKALAELAVTALRDAGKRGIINRGWGGMALAQSDDDILEIDGAAHEWLFPKMAAVVHHGGAGTTASGLLAGRPSVVCAFFGDQLFWGRKIYELGVGPRPIPRRQLTARRLSEAILQATSQTSMVARASEIRDQLGREDAIPSTVSLVEQLVSR